MNMFPLMPAVIVLMLTGIFYAREEAALSLREAFLRSLVTVGVWVALTTELLSAYHLLSPVPVKVLWTMTLALGLAAAIPLRLAAAKKGVPRPEGWYEKGILAVLGAMAAAMFIQGFLSAPNTIDSMTYHLSRVMHWAQGRSIEFYPTHVERQLWMPPWAEYAVMHLYFLGGSDRLAFLVQWGAYAGCVAAASLIAARLGGGRTVQVSAAALCAGIPMAVLQGSSTQTDLIATLWLMCAVAWLLAWMKDGYRGTDAAWGAFAIGLAALTKTYVLFFGIPFLFIAASTAFYFRQGRKFLVLTGWIAGAVLVMFSPHFLRMTACFGSVNPAYTETHLMNEIYTPQSFATNALKNIELNLTMPSDRANRMIRNIFDRLQAALGLDAEDKRIYHGISRDIIKKSHLFYESRAPNPHYLLLGIITVVLMGLFFRKMGDLAAGHALALGAGAMMLVYFVKWQPWITRFHLPLFALGAPLAAFVFARAGFSERAQKAVSLLFLAAAVPWVIWNTSHPFVGAEAFYRTSREEQYFIHEKGEKKFFVETVEAIREKGCSTVGLVLPLAYQWEYPLWAMLRARGLFPDIRHVRVTGRSGIYEDTSWEPCAVFIRPEPLTVRRCLNCIYLK